MINALGRLKNKKAVPILNVEFQKEETKFEATSALAQMPAASQAGQNGLLPGVRL